MTSFPNGIFVGRYKGVSIYANKGRYECLFGWLPKTFDSLRQAKYNITKWSKS